MTTRVSQKARVERSEMSSSKGESRDAITMSAMTTSADDSSYGLTVGDDAGDDEKCAAAENEEERARGRDAPPLPRANVFGTFWCGRASGGSRPRGARASARVDCSEEGSQVLIPVAKAGARQRAP